MSRQARPGRSAGLNWPVERAFLQGSRAGKLREPAWRNPYDDFDQGGAWAIGHARGRGEPLDRLMQQQARMLGLEG